MAGTDASQLALIVALAKLPTSGVHVGQRACNAWSCHLPKQLITHDTPNVTSVDQRVFCSNMRSSRNPSSDATGSPAHIWWSGCFGWPRNSYARLASLASTPRRVS